MATSVDNLQPEDLVITPVLTGDSQIEYRASAVVTATIRGGVVLLDEVNRMSERSWASLAPLMDDRRYIESEVTALKMQAPYDFGDDWRHSVTIENVTAAGWRPGAS